MGFLDRLMGKDSVDKSNQLNKAPEGTAYVIWSCLDDDNSCDECKALEGTCWIPGLAEINEAPLPSCQSPEGCRCVAIYVDSGERGAIDVAAFIRASGGRATDEQMTAYHESKMAPLREKNERQRLASAKVPAAHESEKENPEQAITLYRESIMIEKEVAERWPDQWSWRDFPSLYNRLTLVLEKLGRYDDALRDIAAFEALPCQSQGAKSDRDAIEKRKTRLTRKLTKK
jgi:tetratricopeptide (TPR) repeat protein